MIRRWEGNKKGMGKRAKCERKERKRKDERKYEHICVAYWNKIKKSGTRMRDIIFYAGG